MYQSHFTERDECTYWIQVYCSGIDCLQSLLFLTHGLQLCITVNVILRFFYRGFIKFLVSTHDNQYIKRKTRNKLNLACSRQTGSGSGAPRSEQDNTAGGLSWGSGVVGVGLYLTLHYSCI